MTKVQFEGHVERIWDEYLSADMGLTTPVMYDVAMARLELLDRYIDRATFDAQVAEINNDPEAPCGRCEAGAICPAHDNGAR